MVRNWRIGGTTALACVCSLGVLASFAQERPKIEYGIAEPIIADSGEVQRITFPEGSVGGGIAGAPCLIDSAANCQEPNAVNGLNSTGSYAGNVFSGAFRVADDFSVVTAGNITTVCWWGVYATGGAECAPIPADAFTIRIYADVNGSPTLGASAALGTYVQGTNMVVTRATTGGVLGALNEHVYSATLSGTLVNAAVGTCLWIEITNNLSGCTWFWETGTGDGIYASASQDGDASWAYVDNVNSDMAFCVGNGIANPTNAPCSVVGTNTTRMFETCALAAAAAFPAGYLNIGTPVAVDLRGTVNEGSDPVGTCWTLSPGVGSAWGRFRATRTSHQISTCSGIGTDSLISVYSGTCGALVEIACNDDAACGDTGFLSQVCVTGLTIGTDYFVQIRAFDDAARGVYNLTAGLCLDCQAHQPTGGYLIIPSITGVVGCWDDFRPLETGNISNMTLRCVWWNGVNGAGSRATPPTLGTEVVTLQVWDQAGQIPGTLVASRTTIDANITINSRTGTGLAFGTGAGGGQNAELIDYDFSFANIAVSANTCYWVTVQIETAGPNGEGFRWLAGGLVNMTAGNNRCAFDNENNGVGVDDFLPDDCIYCFDIELDPTVPCSDTTPPANDLCENAQVVACTGGAGVQFNIALNNATESGSDPVFSCTGATGQGSVWYQITTPGGSPSLLIDTCLTDFIGVNDSWLAVYTGPDCNTLTEVACADDGCGEAAAYEEIRIDPALPNTTYWVQLAGEDDFAQLSYVIRFRCPAPPTPPNDLCSNAIPVTIGVPIAGTTLDSSFDANADAAGICNAVTVGPKGVWHTVVSNVVGGTTLEARLCNLTAIDSQVSIFCGPDCNNLTCVTADDDGCGPIGGPSLTTWCAKPGATYWVYVHNFPGEEGGAYELTVSDLGGGACVPSIDCPVAPSCPAARGNADCIGGIDFFDIDPFLLALFNLGTYQSTFCGGSICTVDVDCSGAVDFFDIDPFLNCLFNACNPVPPLCP